MITSMIQKREYTMKKKTTLWIAMLLFATLLVGCGPTEKTEATHTEPPATVETEAPTETSTEMATEAPAETPAEASTEEPAEEDFVYEIEASTY